MVPLVMVMRVWELERRAGEAEGSACRNDVSNGGGRPSDQLPQNKGRLAAPKRGNFPLPYLQELPESCSGGLTGGQRRRLLRVFNEACRALNWMHGEDTRPPVLSPSLLPSENKNRCLRADVQQRVILAAVCGVDADSVVDGHEALVQAAEGTHRLRAWCLIQRRLL